MSGDEAYVRVPVGAFKWLMGEEGDFVPPPDAKGNFWWRSEFQRRIKNFAFCWTPPIRQEQQAIDRALWSEIGLAIGRIEASIQKAEQSRQEQGTRLNAFAQEIIEDLEKAEKARQGRSEAAKNVFQRLDERLGAIEKRLSVIESDYESRQANFSLVIGELKAQNAKLNAMCYLIAPNRAKPASKSSQRRQRRSKR